MSYINISKLIKKCKNPRDRAIISLIGKYGLRPHEIINLEYKNIYFLCIVINDKKIVIDRQTYNYIIQAQNNNNKPFTIQRMQIYNIVKAIGKKCNLDINPRKLRHTYIFNVAKQHDDLTKAAKAIGYKSTNIVYLNRGTIKVLKLGIEASE